MAILVASFICLWIVFLLFALEVFVVAMVLLPIVLVILTAHILVMALESAATIIARGSDIAIAVVNPPPNRPGWRFAATYNQDLQLPIFAEMTLLIIGIMVAIIVVA